MKENDITEISDKEAIFKLLDHYRGDVVNLSVSFNILFDEVLKIKREYKRVERSKAPS